MGPIPDPGRLHVPQGNLSLCATLLSQHSRALEPQLLSPRTATPEAIAPVFLYAAGGSQGDNGFAVGIWSFCGQLTLLAGNSAGDAGLDSYSICLASCFLSFGQKDQPFYCWWVLFFTYLVVPGFQTPCIKSCETK